MTTTYSPWEHIARWPDVEVGITTLPLVNGCWIPSEQVILLSDQLGRAGRRCTLAHEVVHMEEGHDPDAAGLAYLRQERRASDVAARRLIELDQLADVLRYALSYGEVAEELDVTEQVARARIRALTAEEKQWIESRLACIQESA